MQRGEWVICSQRHAGRGIGGEERRQRGAKKQRLLLQTGCNYCHDDVDEVDIPAANERAEKWRARHAFSWQRSTSQNFPSWLLYDCTSVSGASSLTRSLSRLYHGSSSMALLANKKRFITQPLYKHDWVIDSGISDEATAEMDGRKRRDERGRKANRQIDHTQTNPTWNIYIPYAHSWYITAVLFCLLSLFLATAETLLHCCYHSLHLHVHSTASPLLRACQKHISGESTISSRCRQQRMRESPTNESLVIFCINTH